MNPNVGLFLSAWAQGDPGRTAMIDAGGAERALAYGELDRQASRVANALVAVGAAPGDRVAICMQNGLEFVAGWFGAIYAGCATVPIPAESTAREIAFRLEHARCHAVLCDLARTEIGREAISRSGGSAALVRIDEVTSGSGSGVAPVSVPNDSYAMLLYTSGTTGAAKCACITHASLRAHTQALAEQAIGLSGNDRILGTLPMTHSYGIRTTLLLPFFAGASTVFVPRFSPRRTLELCNAHEVTWLPAVPTMLIAWSNEDSVPPPSSLRWCLSAGAALEEQVRLRAEARLGAPVRQAYGLTEANLTAVNAPPDHAVPGSSGLPVPGVEVRIVSEDGAEVRSRRHGEILVRGPNVMAGYLDDPTATRHVMRDGWLHTGDIGFVDEAGRLTIVDRSKDLILRGGASVYPSEVEAVLREHPRVRDAAVVGTPDDYYGEEVVAVIGAAETLSVPELGDWVQERLSRYKSPSRYGFVKSLPRGATGKTLKRLLREQIADGRLGTQRLANPTTE